MLFKPILKKSTMYVRIIDPFQNLSHFVRSIVKRKKRATLTQQFRAALWGTDQASF